MKNPVEALVAAIRANDATQVRNAQMARVILGYRPPLELADRDFKATPLGWAIHGSEHGWNCGAGNYAGTVEALLQAGAKPS